MYCIIVITERWTEFQRAMKSNVLQTLCKVSRFILKKCLCNWTSHLISEVIKLLRLIASSTDADQYIFFLLLNWKQKHGEPAELSHVGQMMFWRMRRNVKHGEKNTCGPRVCVQNVTLRRDQSYNFQRSWPIITCGFSEKDFFDKYCVCIWFTCWQLQKTPWQSWLAWLVLFNSPEKLFESATPQFESLVLRPQMVLMVFSRVGTLPEVWPPSVWRKTPWGTSTTICQTSPPCRWRVWESGRCSSWVSLVDL